MELIHTAYSTDYKHGVMSFSQCYTRCLGCEVDSRWSRLPIFYNAAVTPSRKSLANWRHLVVVTGSMHHGC